MSLHDVTGLRPFLMGLEKQYMCFKFEILNPFRGYTLNSNISIKEGGSRFLMGPKLANRGSRCNTKKDIMHHLNPYSFFIILSSHLKPLRSPIFASWCQTAYRLISVSRYLGL